MIIVLPVSKLRFDLKILAKLTETANMLVMVRQNQIYFTHLVLVSYTRNFYIYSFICEIVLISSVFQIK